MLDGSPLIQLPKRTMVVERLLFTPEEKDFYDAIRQRHSVRFDAFVAEGRVLNNYAHVLAMLQQMRQACDHPFLVLARPDKEGDVTKIGNTLLKRWKELHRQSPATGAGGGGDGEASAAARQPSEAFIASTLQHIQNLQQRAQRTNSGDGTSRPPSRVDSDSEGGGPAAPSPEAGREGGGDDEEDENLTCVICLDVLEDPVLTSCAHSFCRECIDLCLGSLGRAPCPQCRVPVKRSDLISIPTHNNSRFSVDLDKCWRPSAKLTALMSDLTEDLATPLPEVDPLAVLPPNARAPTVRKAVIISQWTSMLDLVQRPLETEGIAYERFDGSLSQPQREKVLSRFKDDPSVRVLLVSLRAGGVGLNLVAAQSVYLMDPWWNPAVEEQAINRVHRIGQAYPVKVKRYLMQQSVEDRILELQSKKSALVKGALGGTSAEESKAMRVEDLKWLFSK